MINLGNAGTRGATPGHDLIGGGGSWQKRRRAGAKRYWGFAPAHG